VDSPARRRGADVAGDRAVTVLIPGESPRRRWPTRGDPVPPRPLQAWPRRAPDRLARKRVSSDRSGLWPIPAPAPAAHAPAAATTASWTTPA